VGASAALSLWHARLQATELRATAREQSYLAQVITGAPTIRAMAAGPTVVSRWLRRLLDEQAASLRRLRLVLWLDVVVDGTQDLLGTGLLIWGASRCLDGQLSLGALMSLVMWGNGLVAALMRFGNALFQVSGNAPLFRRADDLLARPIEPAAAPEVPTASAPALALQDVWFRYGPQEPWVVSAQSLEVRPGQRLCLKGRSGTGKSTLLRLMAGLCAPDRGTLRIDGRPASETRAAVSYLPQDAYLFEGSIASNLRLLSGATPARIAEAARRTGLEGWVATLPMGPDTPVSAGGQNISGGERQLVVLTAAVAADRPVVLLDEAYAHLDRLTRARLQEAGLFAGKTVVEIVHDDTVEAGPERR
jgi:ABC-type bacteriocin/lantibiotic exporter with double-glycine peptidase domain